MMARLLYLLFLPLFLSAADYKYEVSIVAIFNNEARFLKEWIEFHKTVGVEHFYLYNNRSNDGFADVLKPYVESGDVELIDWPYRSKNVTEWNQIQCDAYMDAVKRSKSETHWLAVLDTDEFLFTTDSTPLPQFLLAYKKYGGLVVNWQCYGTSNVKHIPSNRFMIELLTRKAEANHKENRHIKSIIRPKCVSKCTVPHFFKYKDGYYAVSPSKKFIPDYHNDAIEISLIRINHYWSRDEDFVTDVKIPRQLKWWGADPNLTWEKIRTFNKISDTSIFPWLELMKARITLP